MAGSRRDAEHDDRPRPLRRGRAATRRRIAEAALELFAERGFEGTRTRQIAERAGVTEKTLFQHFASKQELYQEVLGPALLDLVEPEAFGRLRPLLVERGDLRAALTAVVADRIAYARAHGSTLRLLFQEILLSAEFRERFAERWSETILGDALALFRSAAERGQLRQVPPEVAVRTLVSSVIGHVMVGLLFGPDDDGDDEGEAAAIVDLFLHGVAQDVP